MARLQQMHAVGTRSLQLSPQRGCLVLKSLLRPQALLTEPSGHRPTLSLDAEGNTLVRLLASVSAGFPANLTCGKQLL